MDRLGGGVDSAIRVPGAEGMVVGNDPAGRLLGENGDAAGLDEVLDVLALNGVCPVRGDDEWTLGGFEQVDGGSNVGRGRVGRTARGMLRHRPIGDLFSGDGGLLDVERYGQMHGAATTGEGSAECAGEVFRRSERVSEQPRAFRDRLCHADLIYLLRCTEAQPVLCGAAANVNDRSLHVVGEGQAGYRIGMAGRREHGDAGPAGYSTVCVRHVDGGLLVSHVDEREALIGHVVHERQGVVACNRKDGFYAGTGQRAGDDFVAPKLHEVYLRRCPEQYVPRSSKIAIEERENIVDS